MVISLDDVLVIGEVTSFYGCLWDKTYRLVVITHKSDDEGVIIHREYYSTYAPKILE